MYGHNGFRQCSTVQPSLNHIIHQNSKGGGTFVKRLMPSLSNLAQTLQSLATLENKQMSTGVKGVYCSLWGRVVVIHESTKVLKLGIAW